MSKRSPSPNQQDGPSGKKTKVELGDRWNPLPTDSKMKEMSVQEKLLAGVTYAFTRGQHQQNPGHNQPSYTPVAALQQSLNERFRVNPSINQTSSGASEYVAMLPRELQDGLEPGILNQRRKFLIKHYNGRIIPTQDASERLHAVLRVANSTPFTPPLEASGEHEPRDRLRLFLQSACREHGYRKLKLDACGFMTVKAHHEPEGEPLGSVPGQPTVDTEDNVTLHAESGSLTLYESDVPDQFGRITTWMWLKICSSQAAQELRYHPAPDASEEDEAWIIIAIPKSQVETLEDGWRLHPAPENETLGDHLMVMAIPNEMREDAQNAQRRWALAFRYSRDGVPSTTSSKESGDIESTWFGFRTDVDSLHWQMILEAMKLNSCLVYGISEIDGEWIHVAPEKDEKAEQSKESNEAEMAKKSTEAEMLKKSTEAGMPRKMKSLKGERKPSGLRNEVKMDD